MAEVSAEIAKSIVVVAKLNTLNVTIPISESWSCAAPFIPLTPYQAELWTNDIVGFYSSVLQVSREWVQEFYDWKTSGYRCTWKSLSGKQCEQVARVSICLDDFIPDQTPFCDAHWPERRKGVWSIRQRNAALEMFADSEHVQKLEPRTIARDLAAGRTGKKGIIHA